MKTKQALSPLPCVGVLVLSLFQLTAFAQGGNFSESVFEATTNTPSGPSNPSNPGTPSNPSTPNPGTPSNPNTSSTSGGVGALATAQGNVGEFLTDSQGRALYAFELDTTQKSMCTGTCAQTWPPLTLPAGQTAPMAATGHANGSLVGTIQRDDGTTQVTYKGMPLYYYAADQGVDDTKGQGVRDSGGNWFLVKPDGTKLIPATTPPTTGGNNPSADLSFLDVSPRTYRDNDNRGGNRGGYDHDRDHGHDHDCYYWGSCYSYGSSCGYYTCYYNGYCCDYCGSCYRSY